MSQQVQLMCIAKCVGNSFLLCLRLALIYHPCVSAARADGTVEHGWVRAVFCLAIGKNMAIFVSHSF